MWIWISSLALGSGCGVLFYWFLQPASRHGAVRAVSTHRVLRLAWPWIYVLAGCCSPLLSWSMRRSLARSIGLAGLKGDWMPEHIVALQVLCAAAISTLACGLCLMLGIGPAGTALAFLPALLLGAWLPWQRVQDQGKVRQQWMLRELPFLLDMTTLCVEAGLNLSGALQQAAAYGPDGPLRTELRHALADMRTGMARAQALEQLADRTDLAALKTLAMMLAQAEQLGMAVGPLLRTQAEQQRAERFLKAETLAMQAPVKILFPLVTCIFPCTFLIISVPIIAKLMQSSW
jgi:tight adherence protein C